MENNATGKRIRIFINENYESMEKFVEISDISSSRLEKIISGKAKPGGDDLQKLHDVGMSVNWALDGDDGMYAMNAAGEKLRRKNDRKSSFKHLSTIERIRLWILENYKSVENFATARNVDYFELYNVLYKGFFLDPELIVELESAGCNTYWLATGEGSQYNSNIPGAILQHRKRDEI